MVAVLATALFFAIAVLGTALFAFMAVLNRFRSELSSFRTEIAAEFAIQRRPATSRAEFDDRNAGPHTPR
jgi:Tfp pilus assembly protein PilV